MQQPADGGTDTLGATSDEDDFVLHGVKIQKAECCKAYNLPYGAQVLSMNRLPPLLAAQQAHATRVLAAVRAAIADNGGWLDFCRYMELVLYAPGLGYYSAGAAKFGAAGDFVTAPEISLLFARALARQVAHVLREAGGEVLELGAGTGRLAATLLLELQKLGALPDRYRILEISAHLREVQRLSVEKMLPEALKERVEWLDALPDTLTGFVLGNELLDALPVHLVAWHEDGPHECGIVWQDHALAWQERPLGAGALREAAQRLDLPTGYQSEISLAVPALVASLAQRLSRGMLLFIDYGFPRREYYHPQRVTGTLMSHYRQYAHADPLLYPGLQDITAHVDFTMVAEAGTRCGLELLGYVTQAQFLINCGLTDLLAEVAARDAAAYLPLVAQAQKLLSPAEMGELFKVIALGRGLAAPQPGFCAGDRRHVL